MFAERRQQSQPSLRSKSKFKPNYKMDFNIAMWLGIIYQSDSKKEYIFVIANVNHLATISFITMTSKSG